MKIKFLKVCIVFAFFYLFLNMKVQASFKIEGIENFPDTYKPYLQELKRKYPYWQFTALYTGLDWNNVIEQEYGNDKNLVPISYSDNWKCTENGKYNVQVDLGWVNASKNAIEYVMNPRNFLNDVRIFQFEKLSYDNNINTKEGIEKILYGTQFYNTIVKYKDYNGKLIATQKTYSDLILEAAIYSGVSPYHLAARIRQEVGPFITHSSISGTVQGYEGLYNFFNIGATSSTENLGAIKNGLRYARDGNGASESVKANYLLPWDTPEKAIKGGAVFLGSSYIGVGQNTLYLQKFDVNDERSNNLFWHQYMTNCLAPYTESNNIYRAYNSNGMISSSIGFVIPVYENMPEYPSLNPNILESDYEIDNTKVYADVNTTLNIRTGPGTSYEVLAGVTRNDELIRIAKGIQNGERWDRVQLPSGVIGYAFQSYIKEIEILPPENPVIPPNTDEPEENLTDIEFLQNIVFNTENELTGFTDNSVREIKKLIKTNLSMEILKDGIVLDDEEKAGTGTVINFKNNNDEILYSFKVIIYGDVNGDGLINSLDVLILQKYILETKEITGIYLKAGNISKNGNLPNSLDVLKIQKHILETKLIEQ